MPTPLPSWEKFIANSYFHIMRGPFTDGWNSAAHFAYGAVAGYVGFVPGLVMVGAFLAYQFSQKDQTNTGSDVAEMSAGFLPGLIMKQFLNSNK